MIKYCYEYHSYFCHYGAKPSVHMYDTKEEAVKAATEAFNYADDAYVSNVYKKVIITIEEQQLHQKREDARKVFNFKKDSDGYGIVTFWDGTKDVFFFLQKENKIFFLRGKEVYPLSQFLNEESCSLKYFKGGLLALGF